MEGTEEVGEVIPVPPDDVTLADLATRMDMFGEQMNWLCENLQSLFQFVNAMGQNGGGIRGLMAAMKHGGPDLTTIQAESEVVK